MAFTPQEAAEQWLHATSNHLIYLRRDDPSFEPALAQAIALGLVPDYSKTPWQVGSPNEGQSHGARDVEVPTPKIPGE